MYVRASLEGMYIILLSRIISVISVAGMLLLLSLSNDVLTEVWEFFFFFFYVLTPDELTQSS